MREGRDIYGRRPTSNSLGKTQERIMALQHAPDTIPGAEVLDGDLVPGSIGAALRAFHQGWVIDQPVTSRRAYERSIALLARQLDDEGALAEPVSTLDETRLVANLVWRCVNHVGAPRELVRATVQFARLSTWVHEHAGGPEPVTREVLQARLESSGS